MAILRSEVCCLGEIHFLIVPSVISFFAQPLPKPPHMGFDLFTEDDKASSIGDKRGFGKD